MSASNDRLPLLLTLLAGTILALVVSGWRPYDRLDQWFLQCIHSLGAHGAHKF